MTEKVLSFWTMDAKEFGQWIRERRKKNYLTVEALAKKAGISKQYLSVIERAPDQPLTGKPSRPTIDVVDRIAKALGIALDEARLAAGYAPAKPFTKPATIEELADALNALGLPVPHIEPLPQDPDGEGFREIVERMYLDIQLVVNRMKRGVAQPRFVEMEIGEIEEIENERIVEIQHKRNNQ